MALNGALLISELIRGVVRSCISRYFRYQYKNVEIEISGYLLSGEHL